MVCELLLDGCGDGAELVQVRKLMRNHKLGRQVVDGEVACRPLVSMLPLLLLLEVMIGVVDG